MRRQLGLASLLLPAAPLYAAEGFRYETSYQRYDEAAGRISVESWYYKGEMNLSDDTTFRFQLLSDAISGASPTGALPGGVQPFLAELSDLRTGILGALSQQIGDHRVEVEFSHSKEHDYISNGLALSDKWELNQKNTVISLGFNYLNDSVQVIGLPNQPKKTYDFLVGASQLLDKNTILAANLTIGYSQGYLNDPYKAIQRTDLIPIGGGVFIPIVDLYHENRPSTRLREVLQLEGTRFFEKYHGALNTALRLSNDTYGIFSQTAQLEWRQAIGGKLEVTPFTRYYHQNAADFFHNTLDGVVTGTPATYPDGSGTNYSADYRLSSFNAVSLGLKARFRLNENVTLSLAYEHYDMSGTGSNQSPAASYPTANVWTFGLTAQF